VIPRAGEPKYGPPALPVDWLPIRFDAGARGSLSSRVRRTRRSPPPFGPLGPARGFPERRAFGYDGGVRFWIFTGLGWGIAARAVNG
jgi:hypothetical protein